jgi:ABC-type nitrate/sulfonate/bicarbonate transport system permease component
VTDTKPSVAEQTALEASPVVALPRQASRKDERGLKRWQRWALRIGFLVLLLGSWELYAAGVSRALLAPPSAIAVSFYKLYVEDPVMAEALGTTFLALILGLLIAICGGIVLGVAMGVSKHVDWVVGPYIAFLFSIPSITLIPLLVVWFGIDIQLRIVLVVLSAIFPVVINTATGIRLASTDLVETAESFSASPWRTLLTVRFPAALPFVFAGINLALSLSLAGVVVAEMTATITGVGGLIITYSNYFLTANLFVPILTLMAASVGITALVAFLERKAMPWQPARNRPGRV